MRAVIYCRVSTKEQTGNLSLPTQQEACVEFCNRQDLKVDKIFIEAGESAKTAERPELQNLLTYCRRNKKRIHCVVVYSLSRFAREKHDHFALRKHLHSLGITLKSVTEPIDDTSTGKLMEGVLASFAQFDNDVRAERTVAGMKAALERGQWTFQPPLGYLRAILPDGKKTMVIDPVRGPLIRQGFEDVANGERERSALEKLTQLGLTTRRGKPVTPQTWNRILSNKMYIGRIVAPEWNLDVLGQFPPLVDEALFMRAQAVRTGRAPVVGERMRDNPDFPLRNFVLCGSCGTPLTGGRCTGNGGSYNYYWCRNHCEGSCVSKRELENLFLAYLELLKPSPEFLALFEASVLDVWKQMQKEKVQEKAALERRVATLKERKHRLLEVYVYERALDKETFQAEMDRISEELTLSEMDLHSVRLDELDIEGVLAFATQVVLQADRLWMEAPHRERRRLQATLFPEGISYSDGKLPNPKSTNICPFFKHLEEDEPTATGWFGRNDVVSPTGFEPVLLP